MGDLARTGDVDVRVRGLPIGNPGLLTEDVCVKDNRLCVDSDAASGGVGSLGAARTTISTELFDSNHLYSRSDLLWNLQTVGAGSIVYQSTSSSVKLSVGTGGTDHALHQSRRYFAFRPGQAKIATMSFLFEAGQTGIDQRAGVFDDNNGFFLKQTGSALTLVTRSNATGSIVNTATAQASWTLDPLDGSGVSGLTLDLTKVQTLVVDYYWPGIVRFGFLFGLDITFCHAVEVHNLNALPQSKTPVLPLRYEVKVTGSPSSGTSITHWAEQVKTDGLENPLGIIRVIHSGVSDISINAPRIPMVGLRAKTGFPRLTILPVSLSALVTNGNNILWELLINPTPTGASWVDVSSEAFTQYDRSATSVSGGVAVAGGFTNGNAQSSFDNIRNALYIASSIAGTPESLYLVASIASTGVPKALGAITYKEV